MSETNLSFKSPWQSEFEFSAISFALIGLVSLCRAEVLTMKTDFVQKLRENAKVGKNLVSFAQC